MQHHLSNVNLCLLMHELSDSRKRKSYSDENEIDTLMGGNGNR